MGPSGFVAVLAGWITTEVGRQPYTVYGLLRTADSRLADRRCRPSAPRCVAFIVVYFVVFGAGIVLHPAPDAHSRRSSTSPTSSTGMPMRAAGITPAPALGATPRASEADPCSISPSSGPA